MTELESLRLGKNNLSGALPSELDQLSRLLELILSENNFSGKLPENLLRLERIGE
jgi:Leucine-rich repeat (LRR) protein